MSDMRTEMPETRQMAEYIREKSGTYSHAAQVENDLTFPETGAHTMGNNTPQAYPAIRRGDAQTGGLLFLGSVA